MTAIDRAPKSRVASFFSTLGTGTMKAIDAMAVAQAAREAGPAPIEIQAETIDQLLRRARLERGMSLEQLSQLTSISAYRLEHYEDERWASLYRPSTDELVRIKTVLNISTESVAKFI